MRMNTIEKAAMNSWIRGYSQKKVLVPMMIKRSNVQDNLKWLEIGCGRGIGVEILKTSFKAREICAFDFDPDQVKKAHTYLQSKSLLDESINLSVGDAAKMTFEPNSFDCVLNFGIIHHCPDWRNSISEIFRVLKPGGKFVFEEVFAKANDSFLLKRLFDHPEGGKFSFEDFTNELKKNNLKLYDSYFCFKGYYIIGVAEKICE